MIVTKKSLPRRTFLRGTGVALALPLLDAMSPALTATAKTAANPVRRLGVVYVPNGMAMDSWTPTAPGTSLEVLPPILQSLTPFRDRLVMFSGLDGQKGGTSHGGASTKFLTGWPGKTLEEGIEAGISIDQFAAKEFGQQTPLASLELALEAREITGSCDGSNCAFYNTMSWTSATTPLPTEADPRVVFERLFGESGSTDSAARLASLRRNRSILDSVTVAVNDLARQLGPSDRGRIDEFLASLRDIERRIQRTEAQGDTELPTVVQPTGIPQSFEEHWALMSDLQMLAYQCDLTRVITLMVGHEFSGRTYPEIGVPEAHHPLSHHQNDPGKVASMAKLNTYHVSLFASYVEKLRSVSDGDGSLLDHTLLMYGAGMSDSNVHDQSNIPVLLIGSPDQFKGGRHLTYSHEPQASLLVTVLDKLGVRVERIANSRNKLDLESLAGV